MIALRGGYKTAALAVSLTITATDRPAQPSGRHDRLSWAVLLVCSLAVHAAVVAAIDGAPRPMTSVGIPAISVEIVFGDNSAAGLASMPGQEAATEVTPTDTTPSETMLAEIQPTKPPPVAQAISRAAPAEETAPVVRQAEPEPLPHVPSPAEQHAKADPTTVSPEQPRHRLEVDARPTPEAKESQQAVPVPPSVASGAGRGGSTAVDMNYQTRVAAHLARHKRPPRDVRLRSNLNSTGVDFSIDGSGRVTTVRIVRSSGSARLDQAAEAMVWQASPFPPPPDHRPHQFSVPISYSFR